MKQQDAAMALRIENNELHKRIAELEAQLDVSATLGKSHDSSMNPALREVAKEAWIKVVNSTGEGQNGEYGLSQEVILKDAEKYANERYPAKKSTCS